MKYTDAGVAFTLSPAFAGSESFWLVPGACAPGFMLTPAPQANPLIVLYSLESVHQDNSL
jgi:hypothetical protein